MYILIKYSHSKKNYTTNYVKYIFDKEVNQENGLGQDLIDIIAFDNGTPIHVKNHRDYFSKTIRKYSRPKELIKLKLINIISRL